MYGTYLNVRDPERCLELTARGKGARAHVAGEWLLAGVNSCVLQHVAFLGEKERCLSHNCEEVCQKRRCKTSGVYPH
jgi:hypothetical protein